MKEQQTPEQRAVQLASDHWNGYIKGLLEAFGVDLSRVHSYNYITAFCHGYKHAIEDRQAGMFAPPLITEDQPPLCPSCRRLDTECHGAKPEYPVTSDGGCEGYIKAESGVHISEWYETENAKAKQKASLCHSCNVEKCTSFRIKRCEKRGTCPFYISAFRERMLDAKDASPCDTCATYPCDDLGGKAVRCSNWTPTAKQEAPTAADTPAPHSDPAVNCKDCVSGACIGAGIGISSVMYHGCEQFKSADTPLDFALPSIALKCTAEEAKAKYISELREWGDTEKGSAEELVERWDCLQAIQTFYERGGAIRVYQIEVRPIMEDLTQCFAEGRDVMGAKAYCLAKNAKRGYYHAEVNTAILNSNGNSFTI
jgi:hypothetical protein